VAAALEALTEAAQATTVPDFDEAADAEDVVEAPRLVRRLREGNAAAAVGRIAKLEHLVNDPRVAAEAVALLEDPPWHATGSKPFWTRLFALLARNPDSRSHARLEAIRSSKLISGASMRGWMEAQRLKVLAETPGAAPKVPGAVTKALKSVKFKPGAARARPAAKKGVSEKALFTAVYENPDDDGPRAMLADVLQEKGDPRGTFIALQLASNAAETRAQQLSLVRKHQREWLGELSSHLGYLAYPSVAPVDPAVKKPSSIELWWNRGFPAAALLEFTRPKFVALAGRPEWATLRRLKQLARHPDLPEDALEVFFKGLKGLRDTGAVTGPQVAAAARVEALAQRLVATTVELGVEAHTAMVGQALERLTSLERLTLHFFGGAVATLKVIPLPRLPRLGHLEVTSGGARLALMKQADGRWQTSGPPGPEFEPLLKHGGWPLSAG
jgi:uncharacterized protein (TIGR02996 family)